LTLATLTVSDVARDSGVNGSAIRFYEKHGLISATRTSGNQRRFDENAACRVKVARVAQRIGMSVNEIRDILADLPAEPGLDDWKRLHLTLTTEARLRIAQLNDALDAIASGRRICEL
jgi:MerR family transcriptional regulator, redox-sensitive transcriptional activator SoxR